MERGRLSPSTSLFYLHTVGTMLLVYIHTKTIGITIEKCLGFQTSYYKERSTNALSYFIVYILYLNSHEFKFALLFQQQK